MNQVRVCPEASSYVELLRGKSSPEGEALRDDDHYSYVAAWEFTGVGKPPELHKEPLHFEEVHPTQRSYK